MVSSDIERHRHGEMRPNFDSVRCEWGKQLDIVPVGVLPVLTERFHPRLSEWD